MIVSPTRYVAEHLAQQQAVAPPRWPMLALGGLLLFIVAVQSAWSIAIILQPREMLYSEAIVYDKAARLLRGEPLYQPLDRPPYTVTAYTPLYYWLGALGILAFGEGFGPGRALSFIAGLVAAGVVGYLAARGTRSRWAGAFAALLFLALGLSAIGQPWAVLYREQVLGVALSLSAIAVLATGTTARHVVGAGILAALAILTKQLLLMPLLAGTIWLLRRDSARAVQFAGTALTLVVAVCATLELTTGAFVASVVEANVNPFSMRALTSNLAVLVLFMAGPAIVAARHIVARARSRRAEDELLFTCWIVSLLPVAGLAKVGSGQNYWIEFAAMTSVLVTLHLWPAQVIGTTASHFNRTLVPAALLSVNICLYALLTGLAARSWFTDLWPDASQVQELSTLVERVRSEPGDVLANPLDVVVLAGRPILLEPYIFSVLQHEGHWDAQPLVQRIRRGEIRLLVLDQHLEETQTALHGYTRWPAPVFNALRETMVLDAVEGRRFIYIPRQQSVTGGDTRS